MAFAWNFFIFINKAETSVMLTSLGLLTCAYAFWFAARHNQAVMEKKQSENSVDKD